MKILGIETSCDETAAAIVTDKKEILSNIILSQVEEHQPFGGVVPEIASRAHATYVDGVIKKAMQEANTDFCDIDAVAVTAGPGLIGGVIVGLMAAKGIASAAKKPLLAVNHLEGHALTARMCGDIPFPFLILLVSGGHCQILVAEKYGVYKKLGATLDDALGEAFDKVAKMLGLEYPGGPIVERLALLSDDMDKFSFPRPLIGRDGCDFSFSGLKTAVFRKIQQENIITDDFRNDICSSFQIACGDVLCDRMQNAIDIFKELYPDGKNIVIAGGVAANKYINKRINLLCVDNQLEISAPPINLCTDNAVMIAWAGIERLMHNENAYDSLSVTPRARWAL